MVSSTFLRLMCLVCWVVVGVSLRIGFRELELWKCAMSLEVISLFGKLVVV